MNTDTLPPNNAGAEWLLLACAVEQPGILPQLETDLFYDTGARNVFAAMMDTGAEDPIELQVRLHRIVGPELAGKLSEHLDKLPSPAGWPYWRDELADLAVAREELRLKAELGEHAASGNRSELDRIGRRLQELARERSTTDSRTVGTYLPEVIGRLETAFASGGEVSGLQTGFPTLDRVLDGLQPCRLYTIGARPSSGKTAMLLQIALNVAMEKPVVFFSLEMPGEEITERAAQHLAGVSTEGIRRGRANERDWQRLTDATRRLLKLPLVLVDDVRDLHSLLGQAAKDVRARGACALFVDYLQLIHVPGFRENRTSEVTLISSSLKRLAMELRVPVVCAAQLNRSSVRDGRTPGLADLRDSGSIEQDSDAVVVLHPKTAELHVPMVEIDAMLLKNRSGSCGAIRMMFSRPTTTFREVDTHAEAMPAREATMPYAD